MGKNYSKRTIQTLFAYSGNKCAFPGCNTNIVNEDKSIIGEICHIEGEKAGSARYNTNMTDEQRNSLDNLILLRPTHHTLIDKKPEQNTTNNLKMKTEHEMKNKNNGYHIPDDILKIVNISINNDKYTLQRTYNLLQIYKGLSSNETKKLWRGHFTHVLKGLTFSQPISEDEKNALRVLFDDLLELKYDKDLFHDILLDFLQDSDRGSTRIYRRTQVIYRNYCKRRFC